ncbi:molybdenum cofactor biosynthesis protein MoaE [Leptospira meyeri]|uniref:molybdenum cofactor biosynthesis protein MoaE n=1 Tax=Leptospira meyeri TaxID=29508 RepID=UPI000C2AA104|nr:molybdenum cofactor biosynthesis protein MoaE [Leptospira meyeri]PKA26373.1 molybdopterin converting factor [Leptospira sp. mixed culture ATI2-C-A1]MCW7487737.1 molybdenum cofactor biosynthesis protein MoaE [Leptospira meyeri]PJZ79912.1 molybdopterin converting factor [Leptospira meyeri]PJZ96130.1 molybdopterin converting factor [Leptospira meyeri]PKA14022.1 molybdopterin converting factor [Leptospira meyeri]
MIFKHITEEKLLLPTEFPALPSMGGFVLFAGIVRDINDGKQVTHLEYEAYSEMANQMIANIIADACQKWELQHADCIHRLGKLNLGEVAVIVSTGSIHRDEAYKANRYIIDRVKHEVPIWKKEFYINGSSEWSKGCVDESHEH